MVSLRIGLVLTLLSWLFLPSVACADGDAKKHFDDATAAYNLGEFRHAAEEYKVAYKLLHDPLILYNIAQSFRLAKDFEQAIFFYRSFLRSVPSTKNRAEVEQRISSIEAQLVRQKEVVTSPPNEVVGSRTPAPVEPSPTSAAPTIVTTPTEPLIETVPVVVVAPTPPLVVERRPVYRKWWLWTIVGVVVVGAAVGVGVALGLPSQAAAPSTSLGNQRVFGLTF